MAKQNNIYCECGNVIENHDTGLCSSCGIAARKDAKDKIKLTKQQERKKAQRLAGLKEKRTPIKPASDKRADQLALYRMKRRPFLNLWKCQVRGCNYNATEIHHMKGREGDLLLDTRFWLAVCRPHHRYITDNPKEAIENGYSISRTKKEGETLLKSTPS